jgi:hypothetical protein
MTQTVDMKNTNQRVINVEAMEELSVGIVMDWEILSVTNVMAREKSKMMKVMKKNVMSAEEEAKTIVQLVMENVD